METIYFVSVVCWLIFAVLLEGEIEDKPRKAKMAMRKIHAVVGVVWLCLLGAWQYANADQNNWKIDATLTSFHLAEIPNGVEKFNSENYGVIVEYHFDDSEFYVQGGIYQNSFYLTCEEQYRSMCDDLSHFIGGGVVMLEDEDVRIGVELGFADGYDVLKFPKIGDEIAVMGGLTVALETFDNQAVKILFTYPIIGLMYQYGFN